MHQTNIIGAAINLVDRFAHLETDELNNLKTDAAEWYDAVKRPMTNALGKLDQEYKPKKAKEWFVWVSEQWWFRLFVGLIFTLKIMPWAREISATSQSADSSRETRNRESSSVYDNEGFDRDGFDASGFDRDGYDRDGYDRDGFDEDGYNEDGIHEDEI